MTPEELFDYPYNPDEEAAFIAGAEWQKSQMLKNAVEGEVTDVGINYLDLALFEAESLGLKDGDKVRIIVLKAEEK